MPRAVAGHILVIVLAVGGAACGGGDESTDGADSGESAETAETTAPAGESDTARDIASYSSVTPVDRATGSAGGVEVLATSFCGEQIGDGVEIIATGLEPLVIVEAEVNGQTTTIQAVGDDPGLQYRIGSAPSYTVEVPTPDGPIVLELDGCE